MLSETSNNKVYNHEVFLRAIAPYRQSRVSITSRILSIKINDRKKGMIPLTDYLDGTLENLRYFAGIVLSEIIGWTESTVNTNILQSVQSLDDRFEEIINKTRSHYKYLKEGDFQTVLIHLVQLFKDISELEKLQNDLTVFGLQYEIRRLSTDLFEELIFETAKPVIISKARKKKIRSINFINKHILEIIVNLNLNLLLGNEIKQNMLPSPDFDLEDYKARLQEYKIHFLNICQRYLGEITVTESKRIIGGLVLELQQDFFTLAQLVLTESRFDVEKEEYTLSHDSFFGNTHYRVMPLDKVKELEGNEHAFTGDIYDAAKLRGHKDCHGYAATVKFIKWLQETLRPVRGYNNQLICLRLSEK